MNAQVIIDYTNTYETDFKNNNNKIESNEKIEQEEEINIVMNSNLREDNPQEVSEVKNTLKKSSFLDYLEKNDNYKSSKAKVVIEKNLYVPLPKYTKGIYLHNFTGLSAEKLKTFINKAKENDLNTFVIDVQKKMIPKENIDLVKKAGIFPVARVVVFEGGLKKKTPDLNYIKHIVQLIEDSAIQGFQEVQLDYIRYADIPELLSLPLKYKYDVISSILKMAKQKANELGILLSADVFGRITLNTHDHIGQKLENFAVYMDTLYPMVYPSHYTNDPARISNPYGTVKEGVLNSKQRLSNTRIVAYIQGFDMKIDSSKLTMDEYIKSQIEAVRDAKGDGWIIWNPRNQYEPSFTAMRKFAVENNGQIYNVKRNK
ncbi:MAG: putative glycoside hydrolase [Spirochaetia bacterium]|nr:putative glycoside hydrolase [Spirochaetia bacterium]